MNINDILAQLAGKAGKVLTTVGTNFNLPQLAPGGLGIQLQQAGAAGLTPEQRIQKSIDNGLNPTEGDFQTAMNMGILAPSRIGGIVTPQQQTQNIGAVQNYLKSQGVTDVSTLNPVQRTQYDQLQREAAASGGGDGGGDAYGEDLALQAWNAAKQQAQSIREGGQRTFQTLLDSIKAFRDRAQTGFANAGQEITNTAGETLGSNARTAQEQEGQLRAKGRALGLGDSSKFLQQTGLAQRLASTQGNTLATKGENNRANQLNLDKNLDVSNANESEANNYLKGIEESANQVESAGVNNYGTALNNILNYQRQLSALQPLRADAVTDVQPDFSGIVNTLNQITGGTPMAGAGAADNSGANLANPTTLADILKRQRGIYA